EQAATSGRDLEIRDWLGDRRTVTVGSGAASYLTTYENYNKGWTATLDGEELTPVRLDGWQQGWRVPAGAGGTVTLSYGPATTYDAALIGSGAGIVLLIGLVLWRRRAENPDADRKSTRLNSSHVKISYAVFCLEKKIQQTGCLDGSW